MVASQNKEVLRILNLVRQKQADSLETLLSTIYVVAQEEIIGSRREAAVLEETKEVIVLTVDIAYVVDERTHRRVCVCVWTSVPQILMGASSSSKIGWLIKISRAFMQRERISDSNSCTCFPGLLPRTSSKRVMICDYKRQTPRNSAYRVNVKLLTSWGCHIALRAVSILIHGK